MGHKSSNYQTIKTNNKHSKMRFIIAVIAVVVAMAHVDAQDQASGPQADAEATNTKHFFGYGYGGYPLLGAGYHYPSYVYNGYRPTHYPSYGYGSAYYGYGGYRPCHGYGCILRNKKN